VARLGGPLGTGLAIVILGFLVLAGAPAQAEAPRTTAWDLWTHEPIDVGGKTTVTGSGGLGATWSVGSGAEISADRLEVTLTREVGIATKSPTGHETHIIEDRERIHRSFSDVEAEIGEPRSAGGQIFTEPSARAEVTGEDAGVSSQLAVPAGTLLAQGGYSEAAEGLGDEQSYPSYVYRLSDPLVEHRELDQAQVEGTVELFYNNATLTVETADGETWSTWAGHRHTDQPGPTSQYEMRVVTVTIRGGSLSLLTGGSVYASSMTTQVDGSVEADAPQGSLFSPQGTVDLGGSSLSLAGDGAFTSEISPGGSGGPLVEASSSDTFTVAQGPAIAAQAATDGEAATPWLGGLLLTSVMACLAYLARWRLVALLPATVREHLYERWKRAAIEAEDDRAFDRGATLYGRLRRLDPERVRGWYGRALCLHEADRHGEALAELAAAERSLPALPVDMMEVEVAAAVEAGQRARARRALAELSCTAPTQARDLRDLLDLGDWAEHPGLGGAASGRGGTSHG